MRIGMVTACYEPVINGVTRMVGLYKTALEALGHEVTVFTLGEPTPTEDQEEVIRSPAIPLGTDGYYFSVRYSSQAQKLMGEMDILHCHHLFMSVEMAHRYGRCPIVYTNHTRYDLYTETYTPLPPPAATAVMRRVWPKFAAFADVVITPSASLRQIMREYGVTVPLEVIPNGVHLRPFSTPSSPRSKQDLGIPADACLAVYVGRLASEKSLTTLLEQVAQAHQQNPLLHLMIIGQGHMLATLQAQSQALGLEGVVHFLGAIDYEQVGNYLAAADLFATASVSEVHPLTVIEAMAAGLPVVAVQSPGIVETVKNGRSGLLVPDPADLAHVLHQLATDADKRRQMGQAAQADSRQFDVATTVQQTVALYERLRQTRPDLQRSKQHGRWQRHWF